MPFDTTPIATIQCRDQGLIRQLMVERTVYGGLSDDGCPSADQFELNPSRFEITLWLVAYVLRDGQWQPGGFAGFEPVNSVTANYHGAVLAGFRQHSIAMGQSVFDSLFCGVGGLQKVIAMTPSLNRAACSFNRAMGMQREGLVRGAVLKNGHLDDLVIFGLRRDEWAARRSTKNGATACQPQR